MTKQINLVLNGKGGVGKSFFATNFVQYLKDRCLVHRALDTDHENSTLKRFHPEAGFVNIEDKRCLDELFTAAETSDLLVIDGRAASTDLFLDYFAEVVLSEVLVTLKARLTIICPINHEADSIEQLRLVSEHLGPRCRYVVVRSQAHSESFDLYDDSKLRNVLRDQFGAEEVTMPRLHDWLVMALNRHNVTVTGALQHPAFHFLDRQRLKHWQNRFYEQVDTVADSLLPPAGAPTELAASPA